MPTLVEANRVLKYIGEKANIAKVLGDEKFNKITTHTARCSFAINDYLAGIPSIILMKNTSHRTEKAFLLYIRISQLENAIKMKKHPFFNE